MRRILGFALAITIAISSSSCFGSFSITQKLYNWNDSVSDNKFVNTLVFYGLNIIPVYGVFVFGDVVIFNLIEFWTGDNPMAMQAGESETEIHSIAGVDYEITASQNRFDIKAMDGSISEAYVFNAKRKVWSLETTEGLKPLVGFVEIDNKAFAEVYTEEGTTALFDMSKSYSLAEVQSKLNSRFKMAGL